MEIIENLDRRIIFLMVLISVILPLMMPVGMDIGVTPPVRNIYDFVENLPRGSVIWMGFDYYNSTRTECDSQAVAFLRHAFKKDLKVFITSTIPDGSNISKIITDRIAGEYGKEYGKDYVILGYKPGNAVMMMQVCQNISESFPVDVFGAPITDLPMMNNVKNAGDIDMVFTATDNASFDAYVQVASTQYSIPMGGGSTAVSVPQYYVYINSGQAMGVLGGLKGAAEYEKLIGQKGTATAGMDAQSFVHLFIVIMILVSNIFFFIRKYRGNTA